MTQSRPAILMCCLAGIAGCASQPFSAESNLRLAEAERQERLVLSPAEQRAALDAMRLIADGHVSTEAAARPAPTGTRWRDVPVALQFACEEVDMAVVRTMHSDDYEMVFRLITLDERPAEVIVRRVDGERVYEAIATVGRFGDDSERASRLLEALRRNMLALGRKRGFDD